jgi:hypothetical protein
MVRAVVTQAAVWAVWIANTDLPARLLSQFPRVLRAGHHVGFHAAYVAPSSVPPADTHHLHSCSVGWCSSGSVHGPAVSAKQP